MKKILLILFISLGIIGSANADSFVDTLKPGIKEHFEFKFKEAFEILSPLAANGDDEAQLYLGVMYKNGEWVERDYFKAFNLFKQSAEQGNGSSQIHLAWMYIDGNGVLQDYKQAKYWFQMAYASEDKDIREQAKNAWDYLELGKN
tara:strand:+ start:520 stop:957 length:438 start_codon:yes stop_codon:yes gene_type:complete